MESASIKLNGLLKKSKKYFLFVFYKAPFV